MNQKERRKFLIGRLLEEQPEYRHITFPVGEAEQRKLLRGLMNARMPGEIGADFLEVQDAYLRQATSEKGVVSADDIAFNADGFAIWKGDITRLQVDAIVNAANSGMTGCYVPTHSCIDNCIHTYAGVQLRLKCAELMAAQGHEESTGQAKITPGYNLPAKYVLHTVGPIIEGNVTPKDEALLASCYHSCMELAAKNGLESVAFCCISTGVFHFPNRRAAEISVETVRAFMKKGTSIKRVIFNVFKEIDENIYWELLG